MDRDGVVRKYIDAWNELDLGGLLALMHAGAAYYDAFWVETCVGRDLARYFRDAMDEEPYWYQQVGDTLCTDTGVVYRYSAHDRSSSIVDEPILYGADVLSIRDGKILTVTDIYCSPDLSDLEEIAVLAEKRHGLPRHADSGLSARKTARIKAYLSTSLDDEKVYLDPDITMSELADKIGCTLNQLTSVIENQFGSNFGRFLDARRVEYAKGLLENAADSPDILRRVAMSSGFKTVGEFSKKFVDIIGVAPADFYRQKRQASNPPDGSQLH